MNNISHNQDSNGQFQVQTGTTGNWRELTKDLTFVVGHDAQEDDTATFTEDDFEDALRKVARKNKPKDSQK